MSLLPIDTFGGVSTDPFRMLSPYERSLLKPFNPDLEDWSLKGFTVPSLTTPLGDVFDISRNFGSDHEYLREQRRALAPIARADMIESDTEYTIHCDVPGVDQEDLEISLRDHGLTINAQKKQDHGEFDIIHRMERRFGHARRYLSLPLNADLDKAVVSYKHGVVTVKVPKIISTTGAGIKKILPLRT